MPYKYALPATLIMNAAKYDETAALERYLEQIEFLMTDFEVRSLCLAIKRDKAEASESARDKLPRWLAEETEEVQQASLACPKDVRKRIKERIEMDLRDGSLLLNRCRKCQRIARAPLAKQCFWCGCDWHR